MVSGKQEEIPDSCCSRVIEGSEHESAVIDPIESEFFFIRLEDSYHEDLDSEEDDWIIIKNPNYTPKTGECKEGEVEFSGWSRWSSWLSGITLPLSYYLGYPLEGSPSDQQEGDRKKSEGGEEELQEKIKELQLQIQVLNVKWEYMMTNSIAVNPLGPQSINTSNSTAPICPAQQNTVTSNIHTDIPNLETPNLGGVTSIPTIPAITSFTPPPPPPPSLPSKIKPKSFKEKKNVVSPEKVATDLRLLIEASDLLSSNHQAAYKNFLNSFSQDGGLKILNKLVTQYHFLIKKMPLDPNGCFMIMAQWESKLFRHLSPKEAEEIRKKKGFEISTLKTENEIDKQISMITKMIEKKKENEEEKKKQLKAQKSQGSVVDELKVLQASKRKEEEGIVAEKQLKELNTEKIDLSESQMFLSFCD